MAPGTTDDTERSRSANDFSTEEELLRALLSVDVSSSCDVRRNDTDIDAKWDWALTNHDVENSEPQRISQELNRLQVLKSYLILDSDRDEAFEQITRLTSRMFKVPICLVSLVDLGRQWFMSNRGLGDVRETPRKLAFCSHAIVCTNLENGVFIVPDAALDSRFKDTDLVTGPPYIRFYAGAPLESPEGFNLGTLCLIDTRPRLPGLSKGECKNLTELAAMVVKTMVDNKRINSSKQHAGLRQDPADVIACAAHDLLVPLSSLQNALHLLKDNQEVKNLRCEHTKELVHTAAKSTDIMHRICQSTTSAFRRTRGTIKTEDTSATCLPQPLESTSSGATRSKAFDILTNTCAAPGSTSSNDLNSQSCVVDMDEFTKSLHQIMDTIPKNVPCIISVDKAVPAKIITDDLKILRSSLNLLAYACNVSKTGSINFSIKPAAPDDACQLLFECEDTGKDIDVSDHDSLFTLSESDEGGSNDKNSFRLGFISVASQIDSLGGKYGFRPRAVGKTMREGATQNDSAGLLRKTGSIFWFSIPVVIPEEVAADSKPAKAQTATPSPTSASDHQSDNDSKSNWKRSNSGFLSTLGMSPYNSRLATCFMDVRNNDNRSGNRGIRARISPPGSLAMFSAARQQQQQNKKNAVYPTRRHSMEIMQKPGSTVSLKNSLFSTLPKTLISPRTGPKKIVADVSASVAPLSLPSSLRQKQEVRNQTQNKKKALVIEDSIVVSKCLTLALKRLGYEVVQTVNGLDGLHELQKTRYDLCLCDFLMPVLDGVDCVRQFRDWETENRDHKKCPRQYIIGISAHANKDDIQKGLDVGMDDFKAKPITYKVLTKIHESLTIQQQTRKNDGKNNVKKDCNSKIDVVGEGNSNAAAGSSPTSKVHFVSNGEDMKPPARRPKVKLNPNDIPLTIALAEQERAQKRLKLQDVSFACGGQV